MSGCFYPFSSWITTSHTHRASERPGATGWLVFDSVGWNGCLGHSSWPYSLLSLAFCSNRSSNSFELSAALRYHFAASALSSGNPPPVSPASYISPKVCWKNQPPCSAALRNYFTASALSFGTPRPMSYIIPKLTWASSVLRAGRLYRGSEQNKVSGN